MAWLRGAPLFRPEHRRWLLAPWQVGGSDEFLERSGRHNACDQHPFKYGGGDVGVSVRSKPLSAMASFGMRVAAPE